MEFEGLEMNDWPVKMLSKARNLMQRVEVDGCMQLSSAELRRNFWRRIAAPKFPLLAAASARLLSLHASSCSAERNWSAWGGTFVPQRNRLGHAVAEKMIFVKGNLARPVEDMAEV